MEQKKIEKLEQYADGQTNRYGEVIYWTDHPTRNDFRNKINELVDAVNELREEVENLKRTIRFV